MTNANVFVAIRTMPWEDCESCMASAPARMFQLSNDRNGAIVCEDCANENGRVQR